MSQYQVPDPMKKLNIWLPFLFSFILVIGMLLGFKLQSGNSTQGVLVNEGRPGKIEELMRFIELKYVDETDREMLTEKAINSVLKELDPHSNYIPPRQLESINEELQGKFEGVGIQFTLLQDTIYVVTPISGGPADKLGIQAGDKIIQIEDSTVAGVNLSTDDVIDKLKGRKGTKVKIGIMRGQKRDLIPYTITRDIIPIYSVDASYMINDNTGYIKINRFSGKTYQEFMQSLETLIDAGLQHLVIDLRQNPGGYLNAATKILDQLFPDKRLLVYTEGRSYARNNYKSTGRPLFNVDKVAILIDEGSASASEILAGAVQDNDRGIIVGRRSFGKGLVQEQYDLSDGSALRLTVARYYTPSGRSIQKPYDDREAYEKEMYSRLDNGELMSKDSVSISDSTKYYTVGGRVVFGGGGIMPDVFIPLDTLVQNEYYARLLQNIPQFAYSKLDTYRKQFDKYKNVQAFDNGFNVPDELIEQLVVYAEKEGVKRNPVQLKNIKSSLKLRLKAYFARQLYQDMGYYYVLNGKDRMLKAALKSLEKETLLEVK